MLALVTTIVVLWGGNRLSYSLSLEAYARLASGCIILCAKFRVVSPEVMGIE